MISAQPHRILPNASTRSIEDTADTWLKASGIGLEEHISQHGNPLYAVEKMEILHKASNEAKALIMIILNAPGEFMKIFGREKNQTMRQMHVISVMIKAGTPYEDACRIFQEAKDLVTAFF